MRAVVPRRWRGRVVGALLLYAVLGGALSATDYAPDPLRLALLVGLCVAALGLLRDSLGDSAPLWAAEPVHPVVPEGSDARLAAYVRLVEDHLTSRTPDGALRDRLVSLSDQRLAEDLAGPPRRLSPAQIDDYLRRIEDL